MCESLRLFNVKLKGVTKVKARAEPRAQGGWSVGLDRSLALPRRLVSNP